MQLGNTKPRPDTPGTRRGKRVSNSPISGSQSLNQPPRIVERVLSPKAVVVAVSVVGVVGGVGKEGKSGQGVVVGVEYGE